MKLLFAIIVVLLIWIVVRHLKRSPSSESETLLIASDPADLAHVLATDKSEGLRMLLASLAVGPPSPQIIELTRTHFAGSSNAELCEALIAQLPKVSGFAAQMDLVESVRSVDDSDATQNSLAAAVEPMNDLHFSRDLKWAIDGLNFDKAVAEFVAAGFLKQPTRDVLDVVRDDYGLDEVSESDALLFTCLLKNLPQVSSFEAYKPSKSVWYDDLIPFVFGNLEPPVDVEDVEVHLDDESKVVAVSWTMDGQRIHESYDSRQPLDVGWFIAVANRHLAALGSERRCLSPEFCDDRVNLWIAKPDRLWPLLRKYHVAYRESQFYESSLYY